MFFQVLMLAVTVSNQCFAGPSLVLGLGSLLALLADLRSAASVLQGLSESLEKTSGLWLSS